jgi:hypothetical protein
MSLQTPPSPLIIFNAFVEDFPSPNPFDMVSEPFCYFFLLFQDHSGLPLLCQNHTVQLKINGRDIILRIDGIIAKVFNTIKDDLETILNLI